MFKKIVFILIFIFLNNNLKAQSVNTRDVFENLTSWEIKKAKYLVDDYFLFERGRALESYDDDEAIKIYENIIDNYPDTPNYRKAFKRLLELKLKKEDNNFSEYFDAYFSKFPFDHEISYKVAVNFLDSDKKERKEKAIKLLKYLFKSADSYTLRSYKKLREIKEELSEEERFEVIKKLYDKKFFDEIVELNRLTPFSSREERRYLIKSLFKTKRYKSVIELTKEEKDSELKQLYLLSLLRIGEKESFLKEVENLYKKEDKNFFDLYLLYANIKKKDKDFNEALNVFSKLKEDFSQNREIVLWNEALLFIRLGDLDRAYERLSELSKNYKKDKYLFWLGKVKEYKGENGNVYYNQLTEEEDYYYLRKKRLKQRESKSYTKKVNKRLEALLLLKMIDEAKEELVYYLNKNSNEEIYLVDYLRELKLYDYLLKVGLRLKDIYLKYPLAYYDLIFNKAKKNNVDPLLVLAVMREESHFRKNAISTAKAYGLMQVIYPTAKRYDKNITEEELFKEHKNIDIGVRYLGFLLKNFKHIEEAVSAYNAGEHNVEKWLMEKYRDIDEFIENIPFLETRNYVKKVMRSYLIYKSLYEEQ